MLEKLLRRNCKIIMDSVATFENHGGAGIGGSQFIILGGEILEVGDSFVKVRVLDKIVFKSYFRQYTLWEEGEEIYLNLKNIVSISEL